MSIAHIYNYLNLDSFGVEIPFSKTRSELICFFRENNIPINIATETQIVVKSKILFIDVSFYISCQFDGEKLVAVAMSPDKALEGNDLRCRYNKIQKALESELGHPRNQWRSIIYLLDPENRSSYWLKNGIKIEHYLFNRFGMEEIINIKL